jgi:uncharacterized protein YprB with RNaseH-like and TPR domain
LNLKRKLATLNPAGISGARAEPEVRRDVLEDLRAKMAEILARELPPPAPRAKPEESLLPFALEETEHGPLCRRHRVLPPSYHVGRMPVDAAKSARSELLALLALDPALARCPLDRALFLDTETSGLGGAGTVAFLIGLAWFDAEGRLNIEQLLLKNLGDESAQLAWLRKRVEQAGMIVSYNGKAFDLPLLATRYVMNREPPLPVLPHLDLLHVGRRLHKARLGACRLVSLESDVLGFERGPDVEGSEIPARFAHFLRTGDEHSLAIVVEHNAWDVVSMAALVGLYGEPVELLPAADLIGMARTLKRGRALELAHQIADRAIVRGAGPSAYRVRGEIAKARGDRDAALADFERLAKELDDPALRLELAKLYEHHVKAPEKALEVVLEGTGEDEPALTRRRSRLEKKAAKR